MSKEQHEYQSKVGTAVIVGFGLTGAGVGVFLSLFLLPDLFEKVMASFLASIVGFILGAFVGLIVSFLVSTSSLQTSIRTDSEGPQLVGQLCVFCTKPISSIVEGEFCPDCQCPVHFKCADRNVQAVAEIQVAKARCPRCGA